MINHPYDSVAPPLYVLIDEVIHNYGVDRERHWREQGEHAALKAVDELGARVVAAAYELSGSFPEPPAGHEWKDPLLLHLYDSVEIRMAKEFAGATDDMADRCVEIATQALTSRPTERVARYLRRLSRCYVAGFLPECVILCRSVLEAAVSERFALDGRPFPYAANGRSPMAARLEKAETLGWIDRTARNTAWTVWQRGNKAVHEDPTLTTEVLETIQLTLDFIDALYHDVSDTAHASTDDA